MSRPEQQRRYAGRSAEQRRADREALLTAVYDRITPIVGVSHAVERHRLATRQRWNDMLRAMLEDP